MIKTRRMIWGGHVARMVRWREKKMNAYRVLVRKPEVKRPLGRFRHRWKYNIKMEFREIGWGLMDWFNLDQDKYQWQALMKTYGFHAMLGNF
jgi:hypothetical protein